MEEYLQTSDIIDWRHPTVLEQARQIASERHYQDPTMGKPKTEAHQTENLAKACFEWVRDQVAHSVDHQMNPVTCRASDVLKYKTGYCYAKSHLLAALLRANNIPAGFCYQRLSLNDQGAPYCLHGFNAVYLEAFGWYRIDSRGNRNGINAQFTPPHKQLAFPAKLAGEVEFQEVLAEPLLLVVDVLKRYEDWEQALHNLPDLLPENGEKHGLSPVSV